MTVYRHEVRLKGVRPEDDYILFLHRPDARLQDLSQIQDAFGHWDCDWKNAVWLKESRIFYVYTVDSMNEPTILTIWYEK